MHLVISLMKNQEDRGWVRWLTSIILATRKVETEELKVPGHPWKNIVRPCLKNKLKGNRRLEL
jgi:hypothetical protein